MNWIVYILECGDGTLYTGISNNLAQRLRMHEQGTGARYTRGRAPFRVIYTESCRTRGAASKRELQIKKLSRTKKLELA